jgi:serine protease
MKRLALAALLAAVPAVVLGATQHYIVRTIHPYGEAVQRLPREDFGPEPRASLRLRAFKFINGFDADLKDDEVQRLIASGEVDYIEPDVERHVMDDTIVPGQQTTPWGVAAVHARDVWPVTKGAALNGTGPIHVAVIDTGIDYHQPEFQATFKGGHNFITGTDDPFDDYGHGTHVAGIIAAADDSEGVVGVAPAVDLYSLKVLNQCGNGSISNGIHAIEWIIQKKSQIGGNWVANLSLGSSTPSQSEQDEFLAGENAGIIFVAAAGNGYETSPVDGLAFPAGYPGVLSVGAIDNSNTVATFSQRGPDLKVVAPGVSVLSTYIQGEITLPDGTKSLAVFGTASDRSGNEFCFDHSMDGPYVFCGTGRPDQIPASVAGKIALVERGGTDPNDPTGFFFSAKMKYVKAAGAIAMLVYNIPGRDLVSPAATNLTSGIGIIPLAMISQSDGATLKAMIGSITVKFDATHYNETFALLDGTSMATPHATGVVALAWAVAPNAAATDVQNAVINSATDLGDPGTDNVYGHGLVNALNAAKQLNPAAFGSPATPQPPTGRPPGRRH